MCINSAIQLETANRNKPYKRGWQISIFAKIDAGPLYLAGVASNSVGVGFYKVDMWIIVNQVNVEDVSMWVSTFGRYFIDILKMFIFYHFCFTIITGSIAFLYSYFRVLKFLKNALNTWHPLQLLILMQILLSRNAGLTCLMYLTSLIALVIIVTAVFCLYYILFLMATFALYHSAFGAWFAILDDRYYYIYIITLLMGV